MVSDDNIINLVSNVKLDPNTLLERAKDVYTHVVTLGWDETDTLNVRASSNLRNEDVVYLRELAKTIIIAQALAEDDDYE